MILDRDVFGERVPEPLEYTLSKTLFVPKFPDSAATVAGAEPGAFYEGLWEGDVAELFLVLPDGGYLEYNFAPNGAWWACAFSAPRVRAERAVFKEFPLLDSMIGNVTAIIGGRFLTRFPLGGTQPDFHRPLDFRNLLLA